MDRKTLTREQAIDTVREYKRVIRPRYHAEPKVMMYGSYADEKIFLIFLIIRFSEPLARPKGQLAKASA